MDWAKDKNKWIRNTAAFAIHAPVERKILDKKEFTQALKVIDLVMEDDDKNVKKKAAWTLKVVGKYYPDETYEYLKMWSQIDNKNTKWIIKNSLKFLDVEKR